MPRVPEHKVLLHQSRQVRITQQPRFDVSESAIVIRMLAAGLCGTDIAMLRGSRICGAEVLGHEGVGVVVSAPKAAGLREGSRVIVNPVHRSHPERVIGHSRDGLFREIFWLDSSEVMEGGLLVECPISCDLRSMDLALAEPIASVLYSLKLLREKARSSCLLIRGSGTIAILAAKLWSTGPDVEAVLISKSEAHAEWLREAADLPSNVQVWSLQSNDARLRSKSFGSAILCCSREDAPEGLQFLTDNVQDGAVIDLMAGFPADYKEPRLGGIELDRVRWNNICGIQSAPPTVLVDQKTGKALSLVGHRGTSERHILEAVELLARKVISLGDVPHHTVSLDGLPAAVRDILSPSRQDNKWIKAMITFPQNIGGEWDVRR